MERWRALAARQYGLISKDQLRQLGRTCEAIRWRLERRDLEEVLPATYRIVGTPGSWLQSLMGLCLWAGPTAVVSHRAAAALWGFEGFAEGPLEIATAKKNQLRAKFRVHHSEVDQRQATRIKGIPVTNAIRTVIDLAQVLDEERLDNVIDEALRRGLTSLDALGRAVEGQSGRPGIAKVRGLLEERGPGYRPSASRFQLRVRRMLRKAGFRGFVEEMDLYDSDGVFLGRPDFVFVDERLLVEAEGRRNHSNKKDFRNDIRRRNRLTAEHYRIIQVTWDDLWEPEEVIKRIRDALSDKPAAR